MFRHIFDIVVILNQSIGINTLLVGCFKSTGKNSWVFFIEKYENTCKSDFFSSVLPKTFITISLGKVLHNFKLAPVAKSILVFPEALGTYAFLRNGALLFKPVDRNARVELAVIVGL